jgi:DNA-binding phage protein
MNTDKIIDSIKTAPNISALARASGVTVRTLFSIRAGSTTPSLTTLMKVSAALPKKAGKAKKLGV